MWKNIKTVTYKGRKIWKKQMKSYYLKRKIKTIGKHINNALKEELDNSVVAKFATTALDGKIYQVEHYNLDNAIRSI